MKQFGKSILAAMGFAVAAVILASLPSHRAAALGDPPAANVDVVNSPTVSAKQSGTWNVGITGTPMVSAHISNSSVAVTGTVAISSLPPISTAGSVSVSNTPSTAIPVVQAPPASTLYSGSCIQDYSGAALATCLLAPAIPSGKSLYVQSASIFSASSGGADPFSAQIGPGPWVLLSPQILGAGGDDYYVGAITTPFSISETPTCNVSLTSTSASGQIECTVMGYLVPAS